MPDVFGVFGQRDAFDLPSSLTVEQTELDFFGVGGKQAQSSFRARPRLTRGGRADLPRSPSCTFRYEKNHRERRKRQAEFGNDFVPRPRPAPLFPTLLPP